jgi:tetratricopeptide (TPR) repeat protein
MKRSVIVLFVFLVALSAYSQTSLHAGDACFDKGDYVCAKAKYSEAFNSTSGKDKQMAEIKLTRANWCADHIAIANQAYNNKNYTSAKENYQSVLDSNPNDSYAKSQLERCNNALNPPPTTTPNVTQPSTVKKEPAKVATTLTTSTQNISFSASGGKYFIDVKTNASGYQVQNPPSWCTVNKYNTWFSINCSANKSTPSRSDWFKVVAGDKEVKITVNQDGISQSRTTTSRTNYSTATNRNTAKSCFNCPKTKDTWGLTLGYAQQTFGSYSMDGIQFGLRAEPLFKYGWGLNTGINLEAYSNSNFLDDSFEDYISDYYAVNIPLHLEYRLNFSKWFNIFAYGGAGFNAITNSSFNDYSLPVCFEYGGGLRVSHVQLNVGKSLYLGDFRYIQEFGTNIKPYQNLVVSISYMF